MQTLIVVTVLHHEYNTPAGLLLYITRPSGGFPAAAHAFLNSLLESCVVAVHTAAVQAVTRGSRIRRRRRRRRRIRMKPMEEEVEEDVKRR